MKSVLILCNDFSPRGGTGILRTLKFCKYLPDKGWEPIVLKIKNNNVRKYFSGKCQIVYSTKVYCSLVSNFVINIGLFMDRYLGNYRYIFLPDAFLTCIIPTCLKAIQINKKERIDVIYSTSPPYSLAIAGAFAKLLIRRPLVIDLRDAWTLSPYLEYPFKISERIDTLLESFVFKISDTIIVTTDDIKNEYVDKYGGDVDEKIHVISNGFDHSDIAHLKIENDKLIITYTGEFYGPRNPEIFISAFSQFIKRKESMSDVEVHFFGNTSIIVNEFVIQYNLSDYIFSHNRIPNEDVYIQLAKSHLLLLIEPSNSLTTKAFEYLASNKPILAIIPKGNLANLITKYSSTSDIVSADENSIVSSLEAYYSNWKNNIHHEKNVSKDFMNLYNREYLTEKLAQQFNDLI